MTRLPHENRQVKGRDDLPSYEIGGQCGAPYCRQAGNEAHHIWRRSFLSGAFDWVELWDGRVIGNKVGLCNEHHREITENKATITLGKRGFFWTENDFADMLNPQPPSSPEALLSPSKGKYPLYGERGGSGSIYALEGSTWTHKGSPCPKCNGTGVKPEEKEKKEREPAKKRETLTIRCPKERAEDGVELLLDMVAQGEEILRPGEKARPMYFTLADMLGLFLLNAKEILE